MPVAASLAEKEQAPSRRSLVKRLLFPSYTDLIFIFTFTVAFVVSPAGWDSLVADGDTGIHIRAGDAIVASRSVPTRDLFSFSRPGQEWFAFEWLSEVAFSFLHKWFALKGVVLFCGVLIAVTFTVLIRYVLWLGANGFVALALVIMALKTSSFHFYARPHIFTLLFTVVFVWLIAADRRRRSARIWLLAPLTVLWTNLHGGFPVCFALIGLLVIGSALEAWLAGKLRPYRSSEAVRYSSLGLACALASLINPYGLRLHRHILETLSAKWLMSAGAEFASPSFRSENMMVFMVLLFLGLAAVFPLVKARKMTDALWILFFAYSALTSVRHVPLFALVVVPIVAREITTWWESWIRDKAPASVPRIVNDLSTQIRKDFAPVTLWGPLFVLAVALGGWVRWPTDISADHAPAGMIARHARQIESARILTSDQWGDYLIYHFYPRQRVFIDGRHNFYGERIATDYLNLRSGQHEWKELLDEYRFDMVLCPDDWALASLLRYRQDWGVVEDDGKTVLFQKRAVDSPIRELGAAGTLAASPAQLAF
jgi:hypothetical protein